MNCHIDSETFGAEAAAVGEHFVTDHYRSETGNLAVTPGEEPEHAFMLNFPRNPQMLPPFMDYGMVAAPWGFQTEAGTHAIRLILSGTLDRHPELKIVLGHLGEALPFWLWRLDYDARHGQRAMRGSERSATVRPGMVHLPAKTSALCFQRVHCGNESAGRLRRPASDHRDGRQPRHNLPLPDGRGVERGSACSCQRPYGSAGRARRPGGELQSPMRRSIHVACQSRQERCGRRAVLTLHKSGISRNPST